MKPDLEAGVVPPNPLTPSTRPAGTALPPRAQRRGGIFWLLLVLALFLTGGAAAGWWWWRRPAVVTPTPPMPENIGDPELRKAVEEARARVQEKPQSADAWSDLGLLLLGHQCYAEADICFAQASLLDSGNARWPYYRSMTAARLDPDQILPFLREAEQRADSLPEAHRTVLRLRLAETLLERGDMAEAESLFRAEWQSHPDNERAALGLGEVALARGDDQTAARLLSPLTQHREGPQYARKKATLQMAILCRRTGDQAAAERYDRILTTMAADVDWKDPFADSVHDYQAGEVTAKQQIVHYEKKGEFREAAKIYLAWLERGRRTSSTYMGAGVNFVRARDYEQGLALLREGQRLDPNNSYPLFRIAEALFQRATEEREKTPDSPNARTWLREAVEYARQATERKQDYSAAYLMQGQALLLLGEPTAAVEPLWWAAKCRPEKFNQQYYLGLALLESACWYRPHHYREAAIHLQNAREIEPMDPRPTQALERLGRSRIQESGR